LFDAVFCGSISRKNTQIYAIILKNASQDASQTSILGKDEVTSSNLVSSSTKIRMALGLADFFIFIILKITRFCRDITALQIV
jgi:hypothetical protein